MLENVRVAVDDELVVVGLMGHVDLEAIRQALALLEVATADRAGVIDLAGISSLTEDAATALLAGAAAWSGAGITVRTGGRAGREAVLRAYARRMAEPRSA